MSDISAGAKAADRRRGFITRAYLVRMVGNLRQLANELESKAGRLPESGNRRIDGATKCERGVALLQEYVVHVEDAQ